MMDRHEKTNDVLDEALKYAEVFEVTLQNVEDWAERIKAAERREWEQFRAPAKLMAFATRLRTWNRWRRAEGEFAWHWQDDQTIPAKMMPETPEEFGRLLDAVAGVLEAIAEGGGPK